MSVSLSHSLQMSSYKRATLEEEEVSDAPAEAASSPDRVEVSECSKHTERTERTVEQIELVPGGALISERFIFWDRKPTPTARPWGAQTKNTKGGHHCVGPPATKSKAAGGLETCQSETLVQQIESSRKKAALSSVIPQIL